MKTERIEFASTGETIEGWLRLPSFVPPPYPSIIQGPGWLGLAITKSYEPYHSAFTAAGYAVLVFNYRGFGGSGEPATRIDPLDQVRDWTNAIGFARSQETLDANRIALFGSGATGGGNAIVAAAETHGVKAVIAQVPIADGRDWLRRMRSDDDWQSFLNEIAADRAARAEGAEPIMVPVKGGLTVPPEEARAGWKTDVVDGVPTTVELSSAEAIFAYRPIDAVRKVESSACMFIAVDNDSVTPTDHCTSLYEAATPPKSLILLRGATHYSAYETFRDRVTPKMIQWLDAYAGEGGGDPHADSVTTLSA